MFILVLLQTRKWHDLAMRVVAIILGKFTTSVEKIWARDHFLVRRVEEENSNLIDNRTLGIKETNNIVHLFIT